MNQDNKEDNKKTVDSGQPNKAYDVFADKTPFVYYPTKSMEFDDAIKEAMKLAINYNGIIRMIKDNKEVITNYNDMKNTVKIKNYNETKKDSSNTDNKNVINNFIGV